jgi:hypothetical protein
LALPAVFAGWAHHQKNKKQKRNGSEGFLIHKLCGLTGFIEN